MYVNTVLHRSLVVPCLTVSCNNRVVYVRLVSCWVEAGRDGTGWVEPPYRLSSLTFFFFFYRRFHFPA